MTNGDCLSNHTTDDGYGGTWTPELPKVVDCNAVAAYYRVTNTESGSSCKDDDRRPSTPTLDYGYSSPHIDVCAKVVWKVQGAPDPQRECST
ncbi:hypothetical protein ABTY53_30870 [Streptomyces noursei]|uniref:hypothetical protein n=1 Tax=Streptomyces noursei TaxID=1971 RepID=UPI003331F4EC